jgi:hypothetical protein
MTTLTLQGRRQCIRSFIDTLLEAHLDPGSARPTLGGLADCLTDEATAGLFREEELTVEPAPYRPHPAGSLRRGAGADLWAHLPNTPCYLHIPGRFGVHYKLEMAGDFTSLALQVMPQLPGLELSENFFEFPVDRLIIDPALVMILVSDHYHHNDVEIQVP